MAFIFISITIQVQELACKNLKQTNGVKLNRLYKDCFRRYIWTYKSITKLKFKRHYTHMCHHIHVQESLIFVGRVRKFEKKLYVQFWTLSTYIMHHHYQYHHHFNKSKQERKMLILVKWFYTWLNLKTNNPAFKWL